MSSEVLDSGILAAEGGILVPLLLVTHFHANVISVLLNKMGMETGKHKAEFPGTELRMPLISFLKPKS